MPWEKLCLILAARFISTVHSDLDTKQISLKKFEDFNDVGLTNMPGDSFIEVLIRSLFLKFDND